MMKKILEWIRASVKKQIIPVMAILISLMIIIGYLYKSIFYTILPGEAGVHWKRFGGGTMVDYIYPEGMQAIPPWDKMYIYNVRLQEIHPELFALTNTGLKVHLYLSIRYAPKYKLLALLHQKVGPDYANQVIIPEVENVLREIIGTLGAEQIYTTGRAVIIEAINKAIERVAQRYINIDSVLIRQIELPDSVAKAIRYKTEQEQLADAHLFKIIREEREADRKRIEGKGIRDQLNIVAESLPEGEILKWLGIKATLELAKSNNAKVVVIGAGKTGLPIIGSIPMDALPAEGNSSSVQKTPSDQELESPELNKDLPDGKESSQMDEDQGQTDAPSSDNQ
jgi:regulator of protease activity HflC (stomatin/prohibitin superfamily)